jgi:sigma-E factor negative regulatory protein RseC
MIEERAIVRVVSDGQVWVQALNPGNCPRCAEGRGCGGGILARLVGSRRPDVPADSSIADLRVGETVVIGISESALIGASLAVYIVPLAAMIGMGAFAHLALDAADILVAAFGLAGLAAGFIWAARFAARDGAAARFRPVVLRRDDDAQRCPRLP